MKLQPTGLLLTKDNLNVLKVLPSSSVPQSTELSVHDVQWDSLSSLLLSKSERLSYWVRFNTIFRFESFFRQNGLNHFQMYSILTISILLFLLTLARVLGIKLTDKLDI